MSKMRNNIWNKPLPRAFGILVLVLSLTTISWLSRNVVIFGTKAASDNIPKDVQISNVSKEAFTVSYITDGDVTGSISYGNSPSLGSIAFDVRDTASPSPHRIHYINVTKLAPSTKYFFSLISGEETFQDGSKPYEVTTASESASNPEILQPVTGRVTVDGENAPDEAVAFVSSENSQLLSVLLKPDGSYNLKLDSIQKKDLSGMLPLSANSTLDMRVKSPTLQSKISFIINQTNPLPPIILSSDYDFDIGTQTTSSASASPAPEFPETTESTSSAIPQILSPKTDQTYKDQRPTFKGKALPNNDVEIAIQGESEIISTVQSDESGDWEFRPDEPIEPGQQTIAISTPNESGVLTSVSKPFTILAQGSQFTEPSVSPTIPQTPTPTVTQPPTATITVSPTASPTPTFTPTPTPTATPTLMPSPTLTTPVIVSPTTQITTPPIPKSGSFSLVTAIVGIFSLIGIGGLIFLLI